MPKIISFLMLASLLSMQSFGMIKRLCKVKYTTEDGWSKESISEVEFYTSPELNTATNSFKYGQARTFALIWFAPDKVVILDIPTTYTVSENFSSQDFKTLFLSYSYFDCKPYNSDDSRKWRITAKDEYNYKFIDPREN